MIKPIIILSFLLMSAAGYAQPAAPQAKKPVAKRYRGEQWTISHQLGIKYTPTSLLDIYGAMLPVGFEYYFQEKFGINLDFSFPLYYVLNNKRDNPQKTISSDYKLRLDGRQYFRLREKNRMYAGVELFFRRQNMILEDSYLHFVNGNCYPYSIVNATKTTVGLSVLMGYARKLSDQFILEGHLGAGIRVLTMETDLDKTTSIPYQERTFRSIFPPNGDRVGDKDINMYIPFAIKIGYLF